jgi:CheY-like chemotaxis protein
MTDKPIFLYIEDDSPNRDLMQQILNALGFTQVHLFRDSTDFLARIEQLSPQPTHILLDIHVEPHDGFEVLRQLRAHEQYHHLTVIAVTADTGGTVDQLRAAGFDSCLAKPLSWRLFPQFLHQILQGEAVWHVQ